MPAARPIGDSGGRWISGRQSSRCVLAANPVAAALRVGPARRRRTAPGIARRPRPPVSSQPCKARPALRATPTRRPRNSCKARHCGSPADRVSRLACRLGIARRQRCMSPGIACRGPACCPSPRQIARASARCRRTGTLPVTPARCPSYRHVVTARLSSPGTSPVAVACRDRHVVCRGGGRRIAGRGPHRRLPGIVRPPRAPGRDRQAPTCPVGRFRL